jgi:glycosyltransferase involved in cell wall biosynthesis
MNDRPLVSVVIPTYNRAQKTMAAVESVLAQTYSHLEIIVIDDGSTDGSSEVLQQFVKQKAQGETQAGPIRYYRKPNQGPAIARNAGIEKAQGEYIAFLDSDDVWLPEKLEWQMRAMEQFKNISGACFTDAKQVSNSGSDITTFKSYGKQYEQIMGIEPDATRLLAKNFCGYWISTLLARTDLIKRIDGFDPVIFFCEDRDLYFRLSQVTTLAYVNKPLLIADRTPSPSELEGRTWEKAEVRLRGQTYMLEKWLKAGARLSPEVRSAAERNLRETHSQWTNWFLEGARYDEALQSVSRGLRYEVTFGLTLKWALTRLTPSLARKMAPKTKAYIS